MPNLISVTLTYDDGTTEELTASVLVVRSLPKDITFECIGLNEEQIAEIGETLLDPDTWEDIDYV